MGISPQKVSKLLLALGSEPTTETSRSSGGLAGRTTTHLHSGLEFGLQEKKIPSGIILVEHSGLFSRTGEKIRF